MNVIELNNVKYVYQTQYQRVEALRGISYSFEPGKVYTIMGSSGCGKTTLLSLMAGLDVPTEGSILVEGVSTTDINLEQYRRERVAVIYQDFRLFAKKSLHFRGDYAFRYRRTIRYQTRYERLIYPFLFRHR